MASLFYRFGPPLGLFILISTLTACNPGAPQDSNSVEEAPKIASQPIPPEERDPNRLWCNEHGLYEDECLICHPELAQKSTADSAANAPIPPEERDPNRLWCNEHGLYEDECLICHPELAQKSPAARQDSQPATTVARDPDRAWCNEHDVYEDDCCVCHPELAAVHGHARATEPIAPGDRDVDRLWCNEHGVYEDSCIICHPEVVSKQANDTGGDTSGRDPDRLWCNAHGVYEDECLICHPELAAAPVSAGGGGLQCLEHDLLERECGICHPELLEGMLPGQGLKVRFESMASAEKAGVRTGYPTLAEWAGGANVLGQISYNKNHLAYITPLLEGVINQVHVDAGDRVEAGDLLAEISAPGLASERGAHAKAAANVALYRDVAAREQKLVDQDISPRQDLEMARAQLAEAEAELAMARQRMLDLGLSPEEVAARGDRASVFPVRAPFAGTITERDAVAGAAVEPGTSLFQIADLSTMWMELSIPEEQLMGARKGAAVTAEFDPLPGMRMDGTLTWIAPTVDETTRMVRARAEFDNADGLLRDNMFGRAELAGADTREATVVVPPQAIQYVDGRPVIFAKLDHDLYETRLVRTGPERRGSVPVLEGLRADEEIALGESYVLKSELLKARLGAGCVHE